MFQTKEDLLTYLFNNDIVIHIENDNSDIMQDWVDTPKETVDYRTAMYWCIAKGNTRTILKVQRMCLPTWHQ